MKKIKSKRLIILSFEGKDNKTEYNYFNNFKSNNNDFIIKEFSSGFTDIKNMIRHSVRKAKNLYDFTKRDFLIIFKDVDCDENVLKEFRNIKIDKNIIVIFSNPSFEVWFLNHFILTTKKFENQYKLIEELKKYITNYKKEKDYFSYLKTKTNTAITNSKKQLKEVKNDNTFTQTFKIFDNFDLVEK